MRAFRGTADGYETALEPFERQVLVRVVGDVLALLGASEPEPATPSAADDDLPDWSVAPTSTRPDDSALIRLLPDASRDDGELAAEFRRLTQDDLRATKSAGLRLLAARLAAEPSDEGRLLVPRAEGGRVAAALTDVRLVLADRLGLQTDEDAEALHAELAAPRRRRGRDDHRYALAELYDALTWWQETLLEVLAADLPEVPTA